MMIDKMKTIRDNIGDLKNSKEKVKNHCMCADFRECKYYFTVIFPPGHYPDGVTARKSIGQTAALEKILAAMDAVWVKSYPCNVSIK